MKRLAVLPLTFGLFVILSPLSPLGAQTMQSQNYEIHMGNTNMTAGEKSSGNFTVSDTVGQTASGLYTSDNYQIGAGFWYIEQVIPFTFTISDLDINFGQLTPQSPQVLSNDLTVSAGGAGGYQILAQENHPPESASGNYIPDVLGDNNDIDETTASAWSQDTTYGFGFRMTGDHVPDDFSDPACDPDCYRQFADRSASPPEEAQIVMSSSDITREAVASAHYKINISGTQEAGLYQNQVIYIAVPIY